MKKILNSAGFGAVLALCAFSLPSQAGTVLTFNTTATGNPSTSGTIVTTGGTTTNTISSINILDFTGISVVGAGSDNGTWTLSGGAFTWNSSGDDYTLTGTLTCSFAANGCGSSGTNVSVSSTTNNPLIQINLASAPVAAYTGNTVAKVSISNATSITEAVTFLNDLGLTPPSSTTIVPGAILDGNTSTACTGTGTCSFTDYSNVLQISMTPEPYTFALVGSGLILVAFFGKRRMRLNAAAAKN